MPDLSAQRQGAIAQLALRLPQQRGVTVEAAPPAVQFSLRGGDEAARAATAAFGVDLPREAMRANVAGPRAALWLGPDEWLLIATDVEMPGVLAQNLAASLAGVPHALVDIGHRQAGLVITGREAATALNGGCPLDLSLAAFPVGMCTRTLFGKAEIVLWRTAAERFHIDVWRSFTAFVVELLAVTCGDAAGSVGRRDGRERRRATIPPIVSG